MTGTPDAHGTPGARRPMPPSIPPRQPASIPPRKPTQPAPGRPQPTAPQPAAPQPTRQPTRPQQSPGQRPPAQRPPAQPGSAKPTPPSGTPKPRKRWGRRCRTVLIVAVVLVAVILTFSWLWVSKRIQHVDALSGAANTPGETYLIVGSDSRAGWRYDDGTEGARTDTIMVLHKAPNGVISLISLPRDSYVDIPGHDANKINAAFSIGGAQLLVATVEELTGLTMDAYMEVGLSGVEDLVDAVGGVKLCYDEDVDDWRSKLEWEAGCHVVAGDTALAFARMRYSDPLGDIGRAERQRQLVSAVVDSVFTKKVVANPFEAMKVADAGLAAFRVSDGTNPLDLARIALTFRAAQGDQAVTGTPPIADWGHHVDGVGSTVLLDPDTIDEFWVKIAEGEFAPGSEVGGVE